MYAPRRQRTVAKTAAVESFGYWSGRDVRLEFRPAVPERESHSCGPTWAPQHGFAPWSPIASRCRRTVLRTGDVTVEMVEHVLAALFGLQVDNCEVWVDSAEMPACDGSSQTFVEALLAAGFETQNAMRRVLTVREVTRLGTRDSWVEARPNPSGTLSVKFELDYGTGSAVGRQSLALPVTTDSFRRELAPARTFLLKSEADWLLAQGFGKRVTAKDLLIFDSAGPIDNPLRFHDECVRHKALDLLGDLALADCDLVGHFVAHRSGHRLNADLVRALLSEGAPAEFRRSA